MATVTFFIFSEYQTLGEGSLSALSYNYSRLADYTFGLGLSELGGAAEAVLGDS